MDCKRLKELAGIIETTEFDKAMADVDKVLEEGKKVLDDIASEEVIEESK